MYFDPVKFLLRQFSYWENSDMYVTQVLDFVWGFVDVALKLFPKVLNYHFAPIEKKLEETFAWDFGGCVECKSYFDI